MMCFSLRGSFAAIAILTGLTGMPAQAGEVRVAVASNFAAPLERIAAQFQQESGHTLKMSSGSSGKFYAQITAGAPFDVLLSADDSIPKRLLQEGKAVEGSRFVYAIGRLVLWSAQPDFVDAKGAVLNKGNFNKLAIADPRVAPYGVAAKETLEKLTMWNAMQERLVKGENITQTYQFAASENAELAFIALSEIMRDGKISTGSWWLVPAEFHKPIKQSAVQLVSAQDPAAAKAFLSFLKSEKAAAIIRSFGYEMP